MLSCLGCGDESQADAERQPLLPQHNDAETRQSRLQEKLHTYQMIRAASNGYMPANKQLIGHLKAAANSNILNPTDSYKLSPSGRHLLRTTRLWLTQIVSLLESKNSDDKIQDFVWYLRTIDVKGNAKAVGGNLSKGKQKANTAATMESLRTIGSLALTNSDFRVFVADVTTVARQVLRDTATAVGDASKDASDKLDTPGGDTDALKKADSQDQKSTSKDDVRDDAAKFSEGVQEEVTQVAEDTKSSVKEHMGEETQGILKNRLKQAVSKLRQMNDYSESVSVITNFLRQCAQIYASAVKEAAEEVDGNVEDDTAHAAQKFWDLVTSFGSKECWDEVSKSFQSFMKEHGKDDNLEELADELANVVQEMLSDPNFFDNFEERLQDAQNKMEDASSESSLRDDAGRVMKSVERALRSAIQDDDIQKLSSTSVRIAEIMSPLGQKSNSDLESDCINTLLPLLIQSIHYVPIPRVEVSTPALDLLIENLILEPGKTVNASSFLPHQLQLSNRNDIDISKAMYGTNSTMTNLLTIKLSGISIAANDLGYWLRLHSGLLRMMDEGIASFYLDDKGIDVTLDVEIGRERLEELITVRNAKVRIHRLNYTLRKSKFACLAWFLKPLLRPILKRSLESKISEAIETGIKGLNRELLFARERLRATRVCSPGDLWTFARAIAARLTPEADPNVYTRVGMEPGGGVFAGRFAPGSLVKVFEDEARDAEQNVFEGRQGRWRNEIFNVSAVPTPYTD